MLGSILIVSSRDTTAPKFLETKATTKRKASKAKTTNKMATKTPNDDKPRMSVDPRDICCNDTPTSKAAQLAAELSALGHGVAVSCDYSEIVHDMLEMPFDATIIVGPPRDRDDRDMSLSVTVARLAANPNAGNVIVLTNDKTAYDAERFLAVGARKCIPVALATGVDLGALVSAWLRRRRGWTGTVIEHGDIIIDTEAKTVTRGGSVIDLTARGYAILERAVSIRGEYLGKQELRRIIGLPIYQAGGAKMLKTVIEELQAAMGAVVLSDHDGLRCLTPDQAAAVAEKEAAKAPKKARTRKPKALVEMPEAVGVPTMVTDGTALASVEAVEMVATAEIDAVVEEQVAVVVPVAEFTAHEAETAPLAAVSEPMDISLFDFIPMPEARRPQVETKVAQEAPNPKVPARKHTKPEPIPTPAHGVVLPFCRRPGKESCRSKPEIPGQGWLFGREPPPSRQKAPRKLAMAA